jgi:hypothetical protein
MQTFLPYADFQKTAEILDYKRLGKQRVEAFQILQILEGKTFSKAWINHPAVKMWKGYEDALQDYLLIIILEWIKRGYKNNMIIPTKLENYKVPIWLGDEKFHSSHRSNLKRKNPTYYGHFNEPNNLPYIWPVNIKFNKTLSRIFLLQKAINDNK